METNEPLDRSENPFASPTVAAGATGADAADSNTEELRAFVGPRVAYYLRKWEPVRSGTATGAGFNWAAFLLSSFWLPYRKMYVITGLLYAVVVVVTFLQDVLIISAGASNFVSLILAVMCGAYGNRLYLDHAQRKITQIRAEGHEQETFHSLLSRQGGTSLVASIGCTLFFFALSVAAFTALEIARHGF